MKLLKGKPIADKILKDLQKKIRKEKIKPALEALLIGENPASKIYVNLKKKAAKKIGMEFFVFRFKAGENENKIIDTLKKINQNKRINGIIVQLPLPKKYNTQKIINAIDPKKDVDGFHPENTFYVPVFPQSIMELIKATKVNLKNKKAIILANSKIFGETMKNILKEGKINSDYTLIRPLGTFSQGEKGKLKNADIIISAVGRPGIITGEMIKSGAIIIDGGITKKGKKVLGDMDFESVKSKVSFITPVPGGVGPVTIACLLRNVYLANKK